MILWAGAKERLRKRLLEDPEWRAKWARIAATMSLVSSKIENYSRRMVRFMNSHVTDEQSDWFVLGKFQLQAKINEILRRQALEYGDYSYFYGKLYQSLGIAGVYGERGTEERFDAYGMSALIDNTDHVLDLGCNAGFMAIYASFRTGCTATGIDINPYMIEVGKTVSDYLRVSRLVDLQAVRIQDFRVEQKYSVVFSFATHWTDDENYRVPIRKHFELLASLLTPGGKLFFETHSNDVGDPEFYEAIEGVGDLFELEMMKDADKSQRHLYLFRARV